MFRMIFAIVAALLIIQLLPIVLMVVGLILSWIVIGFMSVINWVLYLPIWGKK